MRALRSFRGSLTIILVSSLVLLSQYSVAQSDPPSPEPVSQPIIFPVANTTLTPNTTVTITWTPNPHFSSVTLELWDKTIWGHSKDFGSLCYHWINPFCGTLASHVPNTGSFTWRIPDPDSPFPRGRDVFWIKMYVDDYLKPEIGNMDPVLSYSGLFGFEGGTSANRSTHGEFRPGQGGGHNWSHLGAWMTPTSPASSNWSMGAATTTSTAGETAEATSTPKTNINGAMGDVVKDGWVLVLGVAVSVTLADGLMQW